MQDLFPHVKAIMDNEAKGLHFTGRYDREERNGRLVAVPTFSNDTWRINVVTGSPEPIPGAGLKKNWNAQSQLHGGFI